MKTLHLKVDNNIYDILLSMLKGLPKEKIEIIEDKQANNNNLMKYAGKIKWPVDGVEYQRKIRDEQW